MYTSKWICLLKSIMGSTTRYHFSRKGHAIRGVSRVLGSMYRNILQRFISKIPQLATVIIIRFVSFYTCFMSSLSSSINSSDILLSLTNVWRKIGPVLSDNAIISSVHCRRPVIGNWNHKKCKLNLIIYPLNEIHIDTLF